MQNLSAKYGKTLNLDKLTSYCPGCGHGIVTRLVAEAIETLGIRERAETTLMRYIQIYLYIYGYERPLQLDCLITIQSLFLFYFGSTSTITGK